MSVILDLTGRGTPNEKIKPRPATQGGTTPGGERNQPLTNQAGRKKITVQAETEFKQERERWERCEKTENAKKKPKRMRDKRLPEGGATKKKILSNPTGTCAAGYKTQHKKSRNGVNRLLKTLGKRHPVGNKRTTLQDQRRKKQTWSDPPRNIGNNGKNLGRIPNAGGTRRTIEGKEDVSFLSQRVVDRGRRRGREKEERVAKTANGGA